MVVQSDSFNRSRIQTVIVAIITSNVFLAHAPGNFVLTRRQSGLPRDSVVNVSQLLTLDRSYLTERVGELHSAQLQTPDEGLRLVLSTWGMSRLTVSVTIP